MKTIVHKTPYLRLVVAIASIIVSTISMEMSAATPSWLTSDYVAGPFYIRNDYVGFGYQYLYDNQSNAGFTETNCCDVSTSDATNYTNMARVSRNVNATESSAYANTDYYKWVIESKVINSVTYYFLKNIGTSRYFHTGPYGDYYALDGENNSINLYAWNSTLVGSATQIDGSDNYEKELFEPK